MLDQASPLPESTRVNTQEVVEDRKTLVVSKKLGDGAQAKVYKAHYLEENCDNQESDLAVKVYSDHKTNKNGASEKEFTILQQLEDHPNVLKAHDFVKSNGKLQIPRNIPKNEYDTFSSYREGIEEVDSANYMTMELCKMDLFDVIASKGPIQNDSMVRYLFNQICSGIEALHTTSKHAHLDIKLENVLIGNDYKLKLCDFGFAQDVETDIITKYGTESYIAPEIENRRPGESYKGVQADIFSLGVILFIFHFGAPPFTRASPMDRNYSIFTRKTDMFFKVHPSVKKHIAKNGPLDETLIDLLTSMFASDLTTRPVSVQEVLAHPYFTKGVEFSEEDLNEQFKSLVDTTK